MPTSTPEWCLFFFAMLVLYLGVGLIVGLCIESSNQFKDWSNTSGGVAAIFIAWPVILTLLVIYAICLAIGGIFDFLDEL